LQIIDTVVSREGKNSAWVNVVFLGDSGESVSVRVPCTMPAGTEIGRNFIVKRATVLLRTLVDCDAFNTLGERAWSPHKGRFGVPADPLTIRDTVGSWSRTGKE
jgi:hypothetical protein